MEAHLSKQNNALLNLSSPQVFKLILGAPKRSTPNNGLEKNFDLKKSTA